MSNGEAALLTRYKKALEGLTPGGSEFFDDPERCAAHVWERLDFLHGQLLKAKGAAPRATGARPIVQGTAQQWRLSGKRYLVEAEHGFWTDERVEAFANDVTPATGAREIAERIAKEVYGPYMATVNEEHREMVIAPLERIIAACQSAAPAPEQLSNAWRRYQELFGAAPHGTVKQMGALLALIPAPAGGAGLLERATALLKEAKAYMKQYGVGSDSRVLANAAYIVRRLEGTEPAGGERPACHHQYVMRCATCGDFFKGDNDAEPEPPQGDGEPPNLKGKV